jgi:hypothetical protein
LDKSIWDKMFWLGLFGWFFLLGFFTKSSWQLYNLRLIWKY